MAVRGIRHQEQKYPGTDLPYLMHIGNVVLALIPALEENAGNAGFDSELALCCALLHDTVEDTGTALEEIRNIFGSAIASGVSALTKNKSLPKAERMADSISRIQASPKEIWMVKLADRIANLGLPPSFWSREKCLSYAAEGQSILEALGAASPCLSQKLAARIAAWNAGAS